MSPTTPDIGVGLSVEGSMSPICPSSVAKIPGMALPMKLTIPSRIVSLPITTKLAIVTASTKAAAIEASE